jgi:acetoin utilization deacetylase AcuC-like enzyme
LTTAYGYDPLFLEHDLPGHPENRARLERVMEALSFSGVLARMSPATVHPVDERLLARVHAPAHIERVRRIAAGGGGYLDPDTYVRPASYDAALLAAGAVADLVRLVLNGRATNAMALVRPPGHHATNTRGMGFCLFNNVAVGAQAALDEYGLQRVLIADWDVHHGNGTQDIFYQSPKVLFFSTHQHPFYPGTGGRAEIGDGRGRGFTVNVPLPSGVGDEGFRRIYEEKLTPLTESFQPELIIVSAGYDGHWDDPLAGHSLSLGGYWQMATRLVDLADRVCAGRIVVVLEGGYNLPVLAHGVADTCRALLHDPGPGTDPFGPSPRPERDLGTWL